MVDIKDFRQINPFLWEIPQNFRSVMRVPARIYVTKAMLEDILGEKAVEQLINVTSLPGIQDYALAMPDIHQGYGFPIGGVAAISLTNGIISPGGVGYDINCGVRLLISSYQYKELKDKIANLATKIQHRVPSGVGRGSEIKLTEKELDKVLNEGVSWAEHNGFTIPGDQEMIEEQGHYREADSACVSLKAKQRGSDQLGTLGAGNHFLEIQRVTEIFDQDIASAFGIFQDQITIMIHTGSRGFGHQVCTDYVKIFNQNIAHFDISLPDRQLACAPFTSEPGQNYFRAMAAAANFAWTNRQIITDQVRNAWIDVLGGNKDQLKLVYDVAHNIAKLEQYGAKKLIVHRKGATRAFGPNHSAIPARYAQTGQPVFIPGSMGTFSYVLSGTEKAMQESFGSACHGAGRRMSRTKSKKIISYKQLLQNLQDYGVIVRASSIQSLIEEAPEAYKDIESVVNTISSAGIARKVAKLRPVAIIKG